MNMSRRLRVFASLPPGKEPLEKELGGPQSRCDRGGGKKNPWWEKNPGRPARNLVNKRTELSRPPWPT
jgi:hypothetical protein